MLYIFPALLFILNRFILNPRHIGTLFRPGIRFAGPQWHTGGRLLAEEQLEAGLCPVGGQGPWKLGLFQVGNQPVRTSHGNMISLLTSLNETFAAQSSFALSCLPWLNNPGFHGLSRMPCVHPAGGHSRSLVASSAWDLVDFMCKAPFLWLLVPSLSQYPTATNTQIQNKVKEFALLFSELDKSY